MIPVDARDADWTSMARKARDPLDLAPKDNRNEEVLLSHY